VLLAVATTVVTTARAAVDPDEFLRCERAYNNGDFLSALNICGPIAEAGHDNAQVIMGVMHQNGQGLKRDYKDAALWYAKAAKQGNAQGQFNLGTLYRYGAGVDKDLVEAYAWYDVAATNGHADAASARDLVAKLLSEDEIDKGEQRAAQLEDLTTPKQDVAETSGAPSASGTAVHDDDAAKLAAALDELRDITDQAEQTRAADRSVITQLRDLIRRYDWPWRVALFSDDFRDGNFDVNPRWRVAMGNFEVEADLGLRVWFRPRKKAVAAAKQDDGAKQLLGIIFGEIVKQSGPETNETVSASATHSEIFLRVPITNAFAIKVQLASLRKPGATGRLAIGPYQGRDRAVGYRLVYVAGKKPAIELVRFSRSGSAVIEAQSLEAGLEDGEFHDIEWRRAPDGTMTVLLDGALVLETRDRRLRDPFAGLSISTPKGNFGIRQISADGTG
jgi:hypothetical protein